MSLGDHIPDLFGRGANRPPPAELASPEDVWNYTSKAVESNPMAFRDNGTPGGDGPLMDSPFAKQDDGANHKAEYPWLFDPQRGVRWDFDPIELRNLAQPNTWVGMLVQSISKEVSQTPIAVTEADDQAETAKRLDTDPFERSPLEKQEPDATAESILDLLHDPNPDDNWQDTVEMWMADLLEVGSVTATKAFPRSDYDDDQTFVADAGSTEPLAIQTSAPEVWTKSFRGKTGLLDGFYQFDRHTSPGSGGGQNTRSRGIQDPVFFDVPEVIWDDMSPRSNRRYGMPPTLLVKDFLQLLDLTVDQEQQYFSKGSIPSGAWVFEEWDREEVKEWKTENEENVKGKPHKSLMFAGKGGDVRFEPMSFNFKDLEFTERTRWYARVIASVFQVPTAVVGIEPEQINYHTFQGERENFESNTLGPYLQKLERVINDQLIHPHWGREYRFEFQPGMSESTRGMISERVRKEFQAGIRTRNEAREPLGLDPVDDEDDGFSDDVAPDTSDPDAGFGDEETGNAAGEDGGTGNASEARKDEPLRNTDEWDVFSLQPSDVEPLAEEIRDDVDAVFDAVLSDAEVERLIDAFAGDEGDDTAEKSLTRLTAELRDIIQSRDVVERVSEAIREHSTQQAREAVADAVEEDDEDVDPNPVVERVRERDVAFVDAFANRMADDVREVVAEGWQEDRSTREIAEDIESVAGDFEGWGAERIARQELQIATGEARNEFAGETGKVEVWHTAGDDRVRDAHDAMHGRWKRPAEEWEVDYTARGRGVKEESVPGDSEPGIGCRCTTILRDPDEVDPEDHAGVA